jgi:LPS export ABC transporter protein LptC
MILRTTTSLFLIIGLLIQMACQNDLSEIKRITEAPNPAASMEQLRDVEIIYSDSAILRVKIKGPKMIRYLKPDHTQEEFPNGILVQFYDLNGKMQSKLTAKYAIRQPLEKEVIARDSVVWESIEQERLETEELRWDETKKRVYTNKPVIISTEDKLIYGIGFEADQNFKRWRIKGNQGEIKTAQSDL